WAAAPHLITRALSAPPPLESTLQILTPLDDTLTEVQVDVNYLANQATLTPGRHLLQAVLVSPDGEIQLTSIDLASVTYQARTSSPGFESGQSTLHLQVPADALQFGQTYQLEFLLLSDVNDPTERVAVQLGNIAFSNNAPAVAASTPAGPITAGQLNFG